MIRWNLRPTAESDSFPAGFGLIPHAKHAVMCHMSPKASKQHQWNDLYVEQIGKTLTWSGKGVSEIGTDQDGVVRVRVDERYFRPTEVELLIGDPSKAKRVLGWVPQIKFDGLVSEMVQEDIKLLA